MNVAASNSVIATRNRIGPPLKPRHIGLRVFGIHAAGAQSRLVLDRTLLYDLGEQDGSPASGIRRCNVPGSERTRIGSPVDQDVLPRDVARLVAAQERTGRAE